MLTATRARRPQLDDLRALVVVFVVPFSHELDTPDGREYLQHRDAARRCLFDLWDVELPTGLTGSQQMFRSHPEPVPAALRAPVASRADHDAPRAWSPRRWPCGPGRSTVRSRSRRRSTTTTFVANLVDMAVGRARAVDRRRSG